MSQDAIGKGQLQPVIASMVAGVNWNQTFIAETVLPPTETGGEDFQYETYDNMGLVDQGSTKRGLRAESKELQRGGSDSVKASLEDYSAKVSIDIREIESAKVQDKIRTVPASGLNSVDRLRLGAARVIQFNNQIQKEKAVANLVFGTSNYVTALKDSTTNFGSCKISVLQNAMREVQKLFGFMPDTLVLGWKSRTLLSENTNILDRITGGSTSDKKAIATNDVLASLISPEAPLRIVTGTAVVQPKTAAGVEPASATALWTDDSAAFIYTGEFENADLSSPSFGKVFTTNYPDTGVRYSVRTWENDEGNIEWTKAAEMFLVAQVMKAGFLFTNTDQA